MFVPELRFLVLVFSCLLLLFQNHFFGKWESMSFSRKVSLWWARSAVVASDRFCSHDPWIPWILLLAAISQVQRKPRKTLRELQLILSRPGSVGWRWTSGIDLFWSHEQERKILWNNWNIKIGQRWNKSEWNMRGIAMTTTDPASDFPSEEPGLTQWFAYFSNRFSRKQTAPSWSPTQRFCEQPSVRETVVFSWFFCP